jgi:hypothetical protein
VYMQPRILACTHGVAQCPSAKNAASAAETPQRGTAFERAICARKEDGARRLRGVSAPRVLRDGRGIVLNRLGPLFGLERFVTQLLCLPSGGAAICKRWVSELRLPPPVVTRKQHVLLAGEARWCPSRHR